MIKSKKIKSKKNYITLESYLDKILATLERIEISINLTQIKRHNETFEKYPKSIENDGPRQKYCHVVSKTGSKCIKPLNHQFYHEDNFFSRW